MKKCASCSKDLPEAALHCVFCGAKQAVAPAVQPGHAKTEFGYSANEVMQQLGNRQAQQSYPQPQPQPSYQPPPAQSPQPMGQPPTAAANARTMMVPPPAGAPGGFGGPSGSQPGYGGGPAGSHGYGAPAPQGGAYGGPVAYGATLPAATGGGMGIHSPPQPTPSPLPATQPPPYLASQTAARAGRPIEPWKDSLKFMMFVWGAVALATFATPMSIEPLGFNWDLIIDGAGVMKVPPLIWAAVGVLSIAVAAIPMLTVPRGAIALVLGLAGWLVPLILAGMPPWQILLPLAGMLVLIPGLLARHEYTESILPRILVTIGVVCMLLPMLVPAGGEIPLVGMFKGLIEAPGTEKIKYIVEVAMIVVVVMSLLAWMPGPATGGAKMFAWAILLFPAIEFVVGLLVRGDIGDAISKAPGTLVMWAPYIVYSVLIGYGGATVLGKQLE